MTTHMTVHARIGEEWVYVPSALVPKWSVYGDYSECYSWKTKMTEIMGEGVLVQCVTPEVKAKFDNPGENAVEVVQEIIPPPEVDTLSPVLITAAIFSCAVLVLGWRMFFNAFKKSEDD
jgi:hypothetical protein